MRGTAGHRKWDRVVEILQTYFWGGRLPTEFTWKMAVLIPKGNGKFKGIRIVKVLWKALSGVINWRIGAAVQFHDKVHGLRAVWGTGTNSLEAKLLHQLTEMREEIFY